MQQSDSDSDSDEDVKKEEDKDGKEGKDKAEGSSSKGTNTPQGKKAAAEAAKKGKSLKRPGSPLVSDSSGTESTRTKKKKTGPSTSSLTGSRATTPLPGSQSRRPGAGSGSDGEATAGEMSDGAIARKKKQRSHLGTSTGGNGTPAGGSRAGSPVPGAGNRSPNAAARPNAAALGPITEKEIAEKLNVEEGITILKFLGLFKGRVGEGEGQMNQKDWIKLVKQAADYKTVGDKKLLFRKV
jgi:transcription initiation factor TFIIF subunit alpha